MVLGPVIAIGWHAAEVLGRGSVARVLAPMRASIYIVVHGEILWLGGPADVMHPRAVLLTSPPDAAAVAAGDALSVPGCARRPWRPEAPEATATAGVALRAGADRLRKTSMALGDATGFGAWLAGKPLGFPLAGAGEAADALAAACAADDATAAAEAALGLLGRGAGLTPSGDDFVGGAFFARSVLARLTATDGAAWRKAAATVRAGAAAATSPLSAALLGDLIEGRGWAPLHELAVALASDDRTATASAAAHLVRLGHSSGWDLLAGFLAGAR